MGFRFRKTIKIAPGVRMNVGKRGISSISVGKFNFGKRGVYQNINIPGTGLSYRAKATVHSRDKPVQTKHKRSKASQKMAVNVVLQDNGSVIFGSRSQESK